MTSEVILYLISVFIILAKIHCHEVNETHSQGVKLILCDVDELRFLIRNVPLKYVYNKNLT